MLKDIIPAPWRKYIYALVTIAAGVFGCWQAAAGNTEAFVGAVITFLTTALATANTDGKLIGDRDEDGLVDISFVVGLIAGFLLCALLGVSFGR